MKKASLKRWLALALCLALLAFMAGNFSGSTFALEPLVTLAVVVYLTGFRIRVETEAACQSPFCLAPINPRAPPVL